MRITRHGHAALHVETEHASILIDPGSFSPDEAFAVTGLDVIVVTHQHPDHMDEARLPGLLEANAGAALYAEPEAAVKLREIGGDWADTGSDWSATVGDLTVKGVGGRHAVIHPDLPRVGNIGLILEAAGTRLFHPGDTYEYVPEGIDVLAIPLGAPWAKVSETVDFARAVAPRVVLPIHDRTISDVAYSIYWSRVTEMTDITDARLLGQDGSTEV